MKPLNPWRNKWGEAAEPWISAWPDGFMIHLFGKSWAGPGQWHCGLGGKVFETRADAEAQMARINPNPAWLQRRLAE